MLFWGLSFVWTKIVLDYYHPFTVIFLRLIISSLLLISIIRILKYHDKLRREHYTLFLLLAFFEPFMYFIGETFGLDLVSPTISSIIIATIPVITPVLAFWFLKEKLSLLNVFGIVISFAGVLILLVRPGFQLAASPKGIALLFLAVASTVGYTITLKKLAHEYNSFFIVSVQNIIGAVYFLPFFLIFDFQHFITVKPNFRALSSLFFLAVFASSLAFIFYATAVRGIGAAKASIFTNLIPVVTAVFSAWMLNEYIGLTKILGMSIVILGVMIAQAGRFFRFINRNKNSRQKV